MNSVVGGIVNKLGIWNPVVVDLYEVLIWVPSFPLPIQDDNGDNKACDCDLATSESSHNRKHFSIIIALEHEPTTSNKSNIILGIFDMEGGSGTGNLGSRIVRIGVAPAKLLVNEFRLHSVNVL